jgi:hypothetical protein
MPADTVFESRIKDVLNVDLYLKSLALDVATGNWDDYNYNKNNFYLYDNPSTAKFDFIAYDPDNTFGVDWFGIDWAERNCLDWTNKSISLPLAEKILAVPSFFNRYKLFLDTIAKTVINPDSVFPRIDALKILVTPAAVADTFRTLDYGYSIADFNNGFTQSIDAHTPYGIKPFLSTRKNTILNQLQLSGIQCTSSSVPAMRFGPNPARENITISLEKAVLYSVNVKITDLYGQLRKEQFWNTVIDPELTIPVSEMLPGIYFLSFDFQGTRFTARFIKTE